MKTSARNQFTGTIRALETGPVTTEVEIEIAGGHAITATLTSTSAQRMKLQRGQQALALVKASSVVLVTDAGGYLLSARNQLAGTISRVERGAVSTVVGLALPGGATVMSTVTNDAADELGLRVGLGASAIFKAYQVFVAVRPGLDFPLSPARP
jgi:molybdate transport system regulatory protein